MHGPSRHPSRGHPSGPSHAACRDPSSPGAPQPALVGKRSCFQAAGTRMRRAEASWREEQLEPSRGTHGRGCALIKAPAGAGGARGPQRQRELGGACSCSPQHSKNTFYPERRLPGLGGAGDSEVLCPPGLTASSLHPLGSAGCGPSVLGVLLTSSLAHSRELAPTLCQTPVRLCRCSPGSVPAASPE